MASQRPSLRSRSGAAIAEVAVVVGIIALLIGILIPTAQAVRHRSIVAQCASHLQQLGLGLRAYVTEHRALPASRYKPGMQVVAGTGALPGRQPMANDVTAGVYLLVKEKYVRSDALLCPRTGAADDDDTAAAAQDLTPVVTARSNFADYRASLGYSFATPYPESNDRRVRVTRLLGHSSVLAADMNPGLAGRGDNVALPTVDSSRSALRYANSGNHGKDGQNVLFGDGRVEWLTTSFVGPLDDNIYTNRKGETWWGPTDDLDAVLLPTDD
jgi:hypothetical protein